MKVYEYILKIQDRASRALKSVGRSSQTARRYLDSVRRSANRTSSAFSGLGRTMVAAFSITALVAFANQVVATTAKVEGLKNAITFASGSAELGAKNLEFIRKQAEALGLPLQAGMEGFLSLAGATKGTQLEGQKTADIFRSVSTAAAAMQLSSEQARGAFIAIGQIMSKGTVQAEELRGQLGERLPGAFQIAARAMGMTTQQLDKLMATGRLDAMTFLPRFAAQLEKEFSGALPKSVTSMTANINRFQNQLLLTKEFLGNQLRPVINGLFVSATRFLKGLTEWIGKNTEKIKEWWSWIKTLTMAFVAWKAIGLASLVVMKLWVVGATAARIATIAFSGKLKLLFTMMRLNPIGLVITALQLLVAGFIIAWNKSEGFRAALGGLWGAIKQLGSNLTEFVKNTFQPFIEAWSAISEGRFGDAAKALGKGVWNISTLPHRLLVDAIKGDLFNGMGESWKAGAEAGRNAGPIDLGAMFNSIAEKLGLSLSMPEGAANAGNFGGVGPGEAGPEIKAGIDKITGGGRTVRNVTVNIQNLWSGDLKTDISSTLSVREIERRITEMLVRAVGGAEQALG